MASHQKCDASRPSKSSLLQARALTKQAYARFLQVLNEVSTLATMFVENP
jgi:hypothetical protein